MKTTLRRILKYTPAVVLGLLVVAWIVSLNGELGLMLPGRYWKSVLISRSFLSYGWLAENGVDRTTWFWEPAAASFDPTSLFGRFHFGHDRSTPVWYWMVPIPFIMTGVLPLAIGPFISFRFRLWHYLAYTSLVAVELAYYLRWQE